MSTGWLRCRVYNGMFSDELAIQYPLAENAPGYFVPKGMVRRERDCEGLVAVRFYTAGTTQWAVLPTDDQRAILVRPADMVST